MRNCRQLCILSSVRNPEHISYVLHRIWKQGKEEIKLAATGYIQVHAFTSNAQIPLEGAAIAITDRSGNVIAFRLTNRSGQLDTPIALSVPNRAAGASPNTGERPYAVINLYARKENFEEIYMEGLQVFADTVTIQPLQMIPFAELPGKWNKRESFQTPPQNL